MIETIPLSASKLGICHKGYIELAWNIKRMGLLSPKQRQRIQEEADEKLPKSIFQRAYKLVIDLAYDREVYEIAEIPYYKGPPENQNLFTTAVEDYLLRKRPFESIKKI